MSVISFRIHRQHAAQWCISIAYPYFVRGSFETVPSNIRFKKEKNTGRKKGLKNVSSFEVAH